LLSDGKSLEENIMSTSSAPQTLGLVVPQTASKPIADAFALLPVIKVFRAMANAETLYPTSATPIATVQADGT
jgi:hypothetical protein